MTGFEEARRAGGHFCIATHYWEVDADAEGRPARVPRLTPRAIPASSSSPPSGCSRATECRTSMALLSVSRPATRGNTASATTSSQQVASNQQLIDWLGERVRSLRSSHRRARSRLRHRPLLLGTSQRRRRSSASMPRQPMLGGSAPPDSRRSRHGRERVARAGRPGDP